MLYDYYLKVKSQEHMLFSSEIVSLYQDEYIKAGKKIPSTNGMTALLKAWAVRMGFNLSELYYPTRAGGLCRVFPMSVYKEAVLWDLGGRP